MCSHCRPGRLLGADRLGDVPRAGKVAGKAGDVLTVQKAADCTDDAAGIIKALAHSSGVTEPARSAGTQIHKGHQADLRRGDP